MFDLRIRLDDNTIHDLSGYGTIQVRGAADDFDSTIKAVLVGISHQFDPQNPAALVPSACILTHLPSEECGFELMESIDALISQGISFGDLRAVIVSHETEADKSSK